MADKSADPETLLDVDTLILEYLLYVATSSLLEIARARRSDDIPSTKERQAELLIQMVSTFLTIFHANHPSAPTSPTLDFRLRLLKFTVLFAQRFHRSSSSVSPAALAPLRLQRRERARLFRSHTDFLAGLDLSPLTTEPFPAASLQERRQRLSRAFARPSTADCASNIHSDADDEGGRHDTDYGTPASLSLLDTLPLFMALCAAQTALHGNSPTDRFLRLAARYMAEAVLEQYLVYGATGPDPLLEAFAYGFDAASTADAGSDELAVTNMFWGGGEAEEGQEVQGWKGVRGEQLRALLPPEGTPLERHLSDLEAEQLSLVRFEGEVVEFLGTLLQAQGVPVLVELEKAGVGNASDVARYLGMGGLGNSFV